MSINNVYPSVIRTERGLTVDGTRLTLYTLLDHIKAGWSPKLVKDWFDLTDEQINDVLGYIATHQVEVEAEYQQVLSHSAADECYWRDYNRDYVKQIAAQPTTPEKAAIKAKLQAWKQTIGVAA